MKRDIRDKIEFGLLFKVVRNETTAYLKIEDVMIGYENTNNEFGSKFKNFPILNKDTIKENDEVVYIIDIGYQKYLKGSRRLEDAVAKMYFEYVGKKFKINLNDDNCHLIEIQDKSEINLYYEMLKRNKNININVNITKEEPILKEDINEIYEELINTIIGQEDVLKRVFAQIYANNKIVNSNLSKDEVKKMKSNIFINGPTGSGKTFMIEEILSKFSIPYVIVDANDYTAAGFDGTNINDILLKLYNICEKDIEKAEKAIVMIDEIDKLASNDSQEKIATTAVQSALLTLMEGKSVNIEVEKNNFILFDTSKLTFITTGACTGIENNRIEKSIGFNSNINKEISLKNKTEDYVKYGFMPEFIGRFAAIYQTKKLTKDDFVKIIKHSKKSPYLMQKRKFEVLGYDFNLSEEEINEVVDKAIKLDCGARGLKSVINEMSEELLFNVVMNNNKQKVLK